jgi:hypothetical protein
MSKPAKIFMAIFAVLIITMFVLFWKGLGGGPIITPRSAL